MTIKNETYFEFDNDLAEGFTTVPNYILNDRRLSFKAVGVYVQILQYRNTGTHKVYLKSLSNYRTDKKTAVSTGMKELEEYGYISRINLRNEKGQMNGIKYIVRMKPIAQSIENTTNEPKAENLTSENPVSENTLLKNKINKNKINKKENEVVVVSEKETQLLELYKSFKLEKRVMPHTINLLKANVEKFDLEVFEQIFINASSDDVKKKYAYIKTTLELLESKNIFSINDYNVDQISRKSKGSYENNKKVATTTKTQKVKTRFHNITDRTQDYAPNELEKLLKESQSDKFNSNKSNSSSIDMKAIREKAIEILQDKINNDDSILFKANVRLDLDRYEKEINEICNELLNQ